LFANNTPEIFFSLSRYSSQAKSAGCINLLASLRRAPISALRSSSGDIVDTAAAA
jgi:hypothetical protein